MSRTQSEKLRTKEPSRAEDERSLRRLRHRDLGGLLGLMDDYLALADELEQIDGVRDTAPPSSRAA